MTGHASSPPQAVPPLPRVVWLLGWVSLATDAATEAVYPLLPFFLTQVLGAGALSLGIVEGAAEAVNSALKLWSGRASDRRRRKRPMVLAGYAISSLLRPLIAMAQSWPHVFAVRVADRLGKGIRSAPRDAMLAASATPTTRGRVFGFHRGMDHLGAVVGPLLATAFLWWSPGSYRTLFALTMVPGAVAVVLLLLVREDEGPARAAHATPPPASLVPGGGDAGVPRVPSELRAFFAVLALFTLGNSTDAFLLLRLTDAAGGARVIPLLWAALHLVKAAASLLGGDWSDRIGRRRVIGLGWLVYAVVYAGFAVSRSFSALVAWFLVYGLYFGFTEGTEKALVADLAPAAIRGETFGIYNALTGIGALAASVVCGLVWTAFGSTAAFALGSVLALTATALLAVVVRR